jgi:cytochrome c oxidase subunit 3
MPWRIPVNNDVQQRDVARIGMWIFLATEVMLFGGLFAVYTVYHHLYPLAFAAGSHRMDFWMGSVNTAVLLISSLTMVLAVDAAKRRRRAALLLCLALTMTLGAAFLGIKAVEYTGHIHDHLFPGVYFQFDPGMPVAAPGVELFFCLYFVMTGLHALHMVIGLSLLGWLAVGALRRRFDASFTPVELVGLYWHFIDVVWIFLFPLFYLVGGHR